GVHYTEKIGASGIMKGEFQISLRQNIWLASVALFVCVTWTFIPTLRNDFVFLDDPAYVTENAHVRGGLTAENICWAFASTESANWHPVTWLSHMADCQWAGLNPRGHHLTSVLLHASNSVLLFLVLGWLTGRFWPSLFVAAIFGLHPLRVESVAWVA